MHTIPVFPPYGLPCFPMKKSYKSWPDHTLESNGLTNNSKGWINLLVINVLETILVTQLFFSFQINQSWKVTMALEFRLNKIGALLILVQFWKKRLISIEFS